MRSLLIVVLGIACIGPARAGFFLTGQPEIKEAAYESQLATIRQQAEGNLESTGTVNVCEDDLVMAPLVVKIDFQRRIKVADGVHVLGEYEAWLDLEQAIWGFQEAVNLADEGITDRLKEKLGGTIYGMDEKTLGASNFLVTIPPRMPDLNRKMPNYNRTLTAYENGGFSSENLIEVSGIALDGDPEGVVFYPFINLALHKQTATTSQMNGELMINYVVGMNGYFALCIQGDCLTSALPNDTYLDLVVPLVSSKAATTKETHVAARKYGEALMAKMITEFAMTAFDTLYGPRSAEYCAGEEEAAEEAE